MKLSTSAIILASTGITGASAFVGPATARTASSLRMSTDADDSSPLPVVDEQQVTEMPAAVAEEEPVVVAAASTTTAAAATPPKMSQALPFMERPAILDGSMAGDAGFDPLGLAKNNEDLMNYREAEVKHARLAMLAAAGWPLSELFDKKIAALANLTPVLGADDRAPSVLNGGLGKIPIAYWIGCLAAASAVEVLGSMNADKQSPDYFPGNLGFDPFGIYAGLDEQGKLNMQAKEIKNGRLAMMGITGFAIQEFIYKVGVVDETPLFFKPLGEVIHEYANSGYYLPN